MKNDVEKERKEYLDNVKKQDEDISKLKKELTDIKAENNNLLSSKGAFKDKVRKNMLDQLKMIVEQNKPKWSYDI